MLPCFINFSTTNFKKDSLINQSLLFRCQKRFSSLHNINTNLCRRRKCEEVAKLLRKIRDNVTSDSIRIVLFILYCIHAHILKHVKLCVQLSICCLRWTAKKNKYLKFYQYKNYFIIDIRKEIFLLIGRIPVTANNVTLPPSQGLTVLISLAENEQITILISDVRICRSCGLDVNQRR
jgi:hypothetical protein